ncbi:MAG: hypothetical protein AAF655_16330 [Bacteroidota bacterium]
MSIYKLQKSIVCLLLAFSSHVLAAEEQELIVFYQSSDDQFLENTLPLIKAYASDRSITLYEKGMEEGLPEEITTTPAIIYQNAKGRSIYASRYMEFSTIENFIRTSRVVPQRKVDIQREDVFVWQNGRANIVAPLKITDPQGRVPSGLQLEDWKEKVNTLLAAGFQKFSRKESVNLSRTDRLFYLDLHAYFQKDGKLWMSMEVYSQYSCKDPIYSNFGESIEGSYDNASALLAKVAEVFEQQVYQAMTASKIGDAFSPVPGGVRNSGWEELGIPLPEPDKQNVDALTEIPELPSSWMFGQAMEEDIPIVQFRFRAPLDRYIGEIKKISGELSWDEGTQLLNGSFVADMQSLTMGMESFDYNVLNKYVKAYRFPNSSFEFSSQVDVESIEFGETLPLSVKGTFELMRKKQDVQVVAQLTPVLGEEGNPLLMVSASFELNVVDDFRIKGPDGPDPARKMMEFDLNFLMKADHQVSAKP